MSLNDQMCMHDKKQVKRPKVGTKNNRNLLYVLEKWGSKISNFRWDCNSDNFGYLNEFKWSNVTYTWQETSEKIETT